MSSVESQAVPEFPESLPETDRLHWALLTPERKTIAIARLQAVLRVIRGETAVSVAAATGIGRRNLATMIVDWRKSPDLKALRVRADEKVSRPSKVDDTGRWVEDAAAAILAEDPSLSNEQVTLRISADPQGKLPALGTIRTRVRNVRRELKAAHGRFGQSIAVDMSAVEIMAPWQTPYCIAAVIDRETGLVLGRATGTVEDGVSMARNAAQNAINALAGLKVSGAVSAQLEAFEIDVASARNVAADRAGQDFMEYGRILNAAKPWPCRIDDGRRLGARLLETLGTRIKRYSLRPAWLRKPEPISAEPQTALEPDAFAKLVDEAISAHNSEILNRRPKRVAATALENAKDQIDAQLRKAFRLSDLTASQ